MNYRIIRPYRFIVAVFLAMVISLGFAVDSAKVFALDDIEFYSGNDILFTDEDSGGSCAAGGGSLVGNTTTEKVWNYLIGRELSAEQAAGVMGNMQAESGVNPTRRQGTTDLWNSNFNNNAWGIVQWDGGRRYSAPDGGVLGKLRKERPELEKYTAVEYDTVRNPNAQIPEADFDALLLFELEYMYNESQGRSVTERRYGVASSGYEWDTLKLQMTVEDATVFWHNNFEVSADSASQVLASRGGAAQRFFDEYSGNTTPGEVSGSASGGSGRCEGVSRLAETVTAYAWPKYYPQPYRTRTEAYISAVAKAKSEGRYTGDSCYGGGVDCGAFTTLAIVDSGWDPEFNHGGLWSKGAGNTVQQRAWMEANWENVGTGSSINVADLKPGDVAMRDGHTFMFIGDETVPNGVPGFETQIASASQCGRSPMSGREDPKDSRLTWFRKK